MMGTATGVVAIGESNGEPELLEWLSVDCFHPTKSKRNMKRKTQKKNIFFYLNLSNENVTISLIKSHARI